MISNVPHNAKHTHTKKIHFGNRKGKKKQLYGYFKQQTGEIAHEKIGTLLRRKETESIFKSSYTKQHNKDKFYSNEN